MQRETYLPFGRPNFSAAEEEAILRVLRTGWVGMGPETMEFEQELAVCIGAPHVVTVNSCTSALFLSLLVSGIGPGDEVICPSLTWCSTANAALYLGAKPVFCDVDPDTYCATPEMVQAKLSARTRAVMVVHMGGLAVDVDSIRAAVPPHVKIVEDAAHAFGATFASGAQVGTSGNLTCFSFYANKNLSTGEGGAIALFDPDVADRLRCFRLHALPLDAWKRFSNPNSLMLSPALAELGYKMNFTDLQACIGRVQLQRQPEFHATRLAVAQHYAKRLGAMLLPVKMQARILSEGHARHLFMIELPVDKLRSSRDELLLALRGRKIGATIHYAPLHSMPLYGTQAPLPNCERIYKGILTLPIGASVTVEDADYVMTQFRELIA